jgi:peptidyl-dipeptidase A
MSLLLALALHSLAAPAPAGAPSAPAEPLAPPPGGVRTAPFVPPGANPGALPLPPNLRAQEEARVFLELYNSLYRGVATVGSRNAWLASTDVGPENQGRRIAADEAWSAFVGDAAIITTAKRLLAQREALTPLQVRQLEKVLSNAASAPGTIPDVVRARIAAEARAAATQDGFTFCFVPRAADGTCPEPKSANDVDGVLQKSVDLAERRVAWEASKEIGRPLRGQLAELRDLRNKVAREMGYSSYFGYMTAEYGMTPDEMVALLDGFVRDIQPIYGPTRTWATRRLAERYGQPVPAGAVPAHWYPNRWAQEWGGLVEGVDLDPYFKDRSPEWIVKSAEDFYVSLGFAPLPPSFWSLSDLYPVPAGDPRKKNSHASAWHVDVDNDVRSLMSVESDAQWFFTSHHEMGHIYYYQAYTRPEVPPILREGANRAFHEAVGELITIATGQVPYLRNRGILPASVEINPTQAMLEEALSHTVAFLPWSAGTMSHFEYELYEKELPPAQFQARWWAMAEQYQGVAPPDAARLTDPTACDACTKTHIIDDPAGYYDYAIATVIKYQLHEHIATRILKQDPHACDYYGNKEVGAYLRSILAKGATEDWRTVLRDATGEDLSTRAMVAYYQPLVKWLEKENRKKPAKRARKKK